MSPSPQAVLFDVDGVLLDSLPQHLQICRDKAREFGLPLEIPDVDQFRAVVSRGEKISPMSEFFRAVGFPKDRIEQAVSDYERDFMALYKPPKFPGVEAMLGTLRSAGLRLGIVSSNTRANVEPALGEAMAYFESQAVFFLEHGAASKSKSANLAEGARRIGPDPGKCIYIGDQPADAVAAADAGLRFLGVTYGWGILEGERRFDTVKSVREIGRRLSGANIPPMV